MIQAAIARAHEELPGAMREIAARLMLPHWRRLAAGDIREKTPGEIVTPVDLAVEQALAQLLGRIAPQAPCVGEEAVGADPSLLGALRQPGLCWLIDPLDGTANFVEGKPHFAMMVAGVAGGVTCASWILHPLEDVLFSAERGAGAYRNGSHIAPPPAPAEWAQVKLGAHTGFLPEALKPAVGAAVAAARDNGVFRSAGHEYPAIATGAKSVMLAYRILPWDHAPGALLVTEAGGAALRFNAVPYKPDQPGHGLVASHDPGLAASAIHQMIPDAYRSFLTCDQSAS